MQVVRPDGRTTTVTMERRGADPTLPWGDSTPPSNGMLGGSVAGTVVTEKSALGVAAVWSCTTLLSDNVATTPIYEYVGSGSTKRRVKLDAVVENPFEEINPIDFYFGGTLSIALRGNFFGRIISRDKNLWPTQIQPFHPDRVKVKRDSDGAPEYRFDGEVVPVDNVFHVRGYTPAGGLIGMNPIEMLRNSLGLARAQDLYGASFFQNSAFPSGVITVEEDLGEDETLDLLRGWQQAHQGIGQANLPAVLTGGAEFHALSIAPEDAQFLESRQFSRAEIATIWRIPPHMIGDVDRTTSWGQGIEDQEISYTVNVLGGYMERWQQALNRITPPQKKVAFDLAVRLRGSTLQRFQAWTLGLNGGFLNIDEVRDTEDRPPLPDGKGQEYIRPLNFAPIGGGLVPEAEPPNPMAGTNPPSPGAGTPSGPAGAGMAAYQAFMLEDRLGRMERMLSEMFARS